MRVRCWVILGDEQAAAGLSTSAALVGPGSTPVLPDAAEVDVGRWIIWQPGLRGERMTLVCVEIPIP